MNNRKEYSLGEGLKQTYITEPLKHDLLRLVTDKALARHRRRINMTDNILYAVVGILSLLGISYLAMTFNGVSAFVPLLFLVPACAYFYLSYSEFSKLRKTVDSLGV